MLSRAVALCAMLVLVMGLIPTRGAAQVTADVQRIDLPSGMTLLAKERPDPDSVAINVAVRVGSRDEDEATNGAAHFMEHMFFQGTPRRPSALEVDRPITDRGGSLNAATGWELINFNAVVRSADAPMAMDVLGDILTHST